MKKLALLMTILALVSVVSIQPMVTADVEPEQDLTEISVPLVEAPPEYQEEPTINWDMSALDTWCGRPVGSLRVIGGIKYDKNSVLTDDGHIWSFENLDIQYDQLYLIWFDDMGTKEVDDDEIIKIWKEVNFQC